MGFDTCDVCGKPGADREHRTPRPSDPSDMCCVLVTHDGCMSGGKTAAEWDEWIESDEARDRGFIFLT